jgi:ribosome biogenesis GTPase A
VTELVKPLLKSKKNGNDKGLIAVPFIIGVSHEMNINWYPGHMKKTEELLKEQLQLIDVVLELLDARIPRSSSNPKLSSILQHKKRIIVLNKSDLADDGVTEDWERYFEGLGLLVIKTNSVAGGSRRHILEAVKTAFAEKTAHLTSRGRKPRPARVMVVGIPNVGKSTIINQLVGKGSAKTGDKPGVTRGKQWIRVHAQIELLDTPGILWPKFEDPLTGIHLAQTGAIRDEIIDQQELAHDLIRELLQKYPHDLQARYGGDVTASPLAYMEWIAQGARLYHARRRGRSASCRHHRPR